MIEVWKESKQSGALSVFSPSLTVSADDSPKAAKMVEHLRFLPHTLLRQLQTSYSMEGFVSYIDCGLLIVVSQTAVHQMLPCRAICAATLANRFCQASSITLDCSPSYLSSHL